MSVVLIEKGMGSVTQKSVTDRRTDGHTDGQTDKRTDRRQRIDRYVSPLLKKVTQKDLDNDSLWGYMQCYPKYFEITPELGKWTGTGPYTYARIGANNWSISIENQIFCSFYIKDIKTHRQTSIK